MSNPYYTASGTPPASSFGASAAMRGEFATIMAAFDKLPTLAGNASKIVTVNGGESGLGVSPVSINAILQMLDPTFVSDYTGIPNGAKRLNPATGLEQWNGTTWAAVPLGYISSAGGNLAGALVFANNIALDWKDTGAVTRRVALVNNINQVLLGDVDNALSGTVNVRAQGQLNLQINASTIALIGSGGMQINGGLSATGDTLTLGPGTTSVLICDGSGNTDLRGNTIDFKDETGATTFGTFDATGQFNVGGLGVTGAYKGAFAGPLVFDSRSTINGIIGSGSTSDVFTYDTSKTIGNYSLAWKATSWAPGGPIAALSGFGGISLFTASLERVRLLGNGNLMVNRTTDDGNKFQVTGNASISGVYYSTNPEGLRIANDTAYIAFFESTDATRQGYLQVTTGNMVTLAAEAGNAMQLNTGGVARLSISTAGVITEGTSSGNEMGYKGIPVSSGWVPGQCWATTASQTVSARAAGQTFCVFNNSASSITLTQGGGVTMRLNGTTATGNRTLLPFGFATLWYVSSSVVVVSGAVA